MASDEWNPFKQAILAIYAHKEPVPGSAFVGKTKMHTVLPEGLGCVQVRKIRQGKRLRRIERHLVFGHPSDIRDRLQQSGTGNIHPSYIERCNGTIRASLARFVRKTLNFSKQLFMHSASIDFFQAWYNFVKPHQSLRQPIDHPKKKWLERTPAMAEGLTDHVWTLKELFSFRVPVH